MGRTFSTTHPGNFCRALYIPHSNDKYNFEFVSGAFRVTEFCPEWEIPQYVPSSPKSKALKSLA